MSAAIEIRRDGDEWIFDDGSALIRMTKPAAGIVERFVDRWEHEDGSRSDTPRSHSPKRLGCTEGVS